MNNVAEKSLGDGYSAIFNFEAALRAEWPAERVEKVLAVTSSPETLDAMPIHEFMTLFTA